MRTVILKITSTVASLLVRLNKAVIKSGEVQAQVEKTRTEFYQKYPENFIRRGIL